MTNSTEQKEVAEQLQKHKNCYLAIRLHLKTGTPVIVMVKNGKEREVKNTLCFLSNHTAKEAYDKINALTRKRNFYFPWEQKSIELMESGFFEQLFGEFYEKELVER